MKPAEFNRSILPIVSWIIVSCFVTNSACALQSTLTFDGEVMLAEGRPLANNTTHDLRIVSMIGDGEYVKTGDVVAELDSRVLGMQKAAAEATVEIVESQLQKKKVELVQLENEVESEITIAEKRLALLKLEEESNFGSNGTFVLKRRSLENQLKIAQQRLEVLGLERKRPDAAAEIELELRQTKMKIREMEGELAHLQKLAQPTEKQRFAMEEFEMGNRVAMLKRRHANRRKVLDAELTILKAEFKIAKLKLDQSRLQMEATRLIAPIDGRVFFLSDKSGSRPTIGSVVQSGTQIAEIQARASQQVRIQLPPEKLRVVKEGQPATVTLRLADKTIQLPAKVHRIVPPSESDWKAGVRLYSTTLSVDQSDFNLIAGEKVKVQFLDQN